jgi:hypothetical protein
MFDKLNERVKKLVAIDISLIKWSSFFGTLIVAKLFPQLLKINYPVLIVLMILCAIRPVYRFWFKK